ncbi:MAG: DUF1993 domain-containing protein, partial [Pseudomonadota bacterium]
VGTYLQLLKGFSGTLDKGAKHFSENNIGLAGVLDLKLQDDMFNFLFQVIAVAHHSAGAIDGLKSGQFTPPNFAQKLDYEGLQNLISQSIEKLEGEDKDAINALADGQVIFSLGDNKIPFTVPNFVLSFSLPNFYFHTTTAYDILRGQGVKIGKMDFLGPMRMGV